MQKPMFRATPQQLNMFARFLSSAKGEGDITQQDVIAYLNDGTHFISEEEQKQESYTSVFKMGVLGGAFASDTITDARTLLPRFGHSNIPCSCVINEVQIDGNIDFMGFGTGVILDSVKSYKFPDRLHTHYNWLMPAMQPHGLKELVYIISDGFTVHRESYSVRTYNFDRINDELQLFAQFLQEYSHQITNRSYYKTMYHEA